jgi:hypothetical protein
MHDEAGRRAFVPFFGIHSVSRSVVTIDEPTWLAEQPAPPNEYRRRLSLGLNDEDRGSDE